MPASRLHPLVLRRRAVSPPDSEPQPAPGQEPAPAQVPDPAVQRAREAGGPIDHACYACECGYVFVAPVSTTVACPHCHAPQAW